MRLVRRSSLISLLALALAALAVGAAPAAAKTTFSAKVLVSEKYPAFHGAIRSKSAFCEAKRPIVVYRRRIGKKDKLLAHGRSFGDGTWKVSVGKKLSGGDFYVRLPGFGSAALGIMCSEELSKIVKVR
jgi:hypothetical protein